MTEFDIQLSLRVRNVHLDASTSGIRASIQLQLDGNTHYVEVSQTETVYDEVNVYFRHNYHLPYRFDRNQKMQIIVYRVRDESGVFSGTLGRVEFCLPQLVSTGKMSMPLAPSPSFIDITATVPDVHSHGVRLRFSAAHLHSPSHLPLCSYLAVLLRTEEATLMLHKTETIKDNKYPEWREFVLPLHVIQQYPTAALQIHCYNYNVNADDTLIGYFSTNLAQLQHGVGPQNSYMLINANGVRVSEKTSVDLQKVETCLVTSFLELVHKGLHVPLTVGLDMTASNGNPLQPGSLHYIHPHSISPYEKIMLATIPPMLPFMAQPKIGALGFGAKIEPNYTLSQCFNLAGSSSEVSGLHGLQEAYRRSRMAVQPFAPTDYSEVIYHVSKFAKAESRRRLGLYFVCLLLTDGGPFNPKRTIDAIVDASPHPISIVAIGIGEGRDNSVIRSLESPFLKHSDGRPLARQVPEKNEVFQNFRFVSASQLGRSDALALVTSQIAAWHSANPMKP